MKLGRYTPKEGYIVLADPQNPPILHTWWKHLWKLKAPPRSRLLLWCILRNKIPTGDNLMKRAFFGPHWCHFCKKDGESASHIFLNCQVIHHLWNLVSSVVPSNCNWKPGTLVDAWNIWFSSVTPHKLRKIPLLFCWAVWIARNQLIFQNSPPRWTIIAAMIKVDYDLILDDLPIAKARINTQELIDPN